MATPLPAISPPEPVLTMVREYPTLKAFYDALSTRVGDMADAIGFTPSIANVPGFAERWNELVGNLQRTAGLMRTVEGAINTAIAFALVNGWITNEQVQEYWTAREDLGVAPLIVWAIAVAVVAIIAAAFATVASTYTQARFAARTTAAQYGIQLSEWRRAIDDGVIPRTSIMPSPIPAVPGVPRSWIETSVTGAVGVGVLAVVALALFALTGRNRG